MMDIIIQSCYSDSPSVLLCKDSCTVLKYAPLIYRNFPFLIVGSIAIAFIIVTWIYNFDAPTAPDDTKMYLSQFSEHYLEADSLTDRIKYFFSQLNYPHTKLTGRVLSALYFSIFGVVNFKFLMFTGVLALIGFLFLYQKLYHVEPVSLIPIALLLLAPSVVTLWTLPMTGQAFLPVYALLVCYLFSKQRYVLAAVIAFITSFTQAPGIAIFLALLPLFLDKKHRRLFPVLLWSGTFFVTFLAYSAVISPDGSLPARPNIPECFYSLAVYQGYFLSLPLGTRIAYLLKFPLLQVFKTTHFLSFLFLVFIAASLSWVVLRSVKKRSYHVLPPFCFMLFCLAPGLMIAWNGDNCAMLTDLPAPRYIMFALMGWVGIYIFLLSASGRKTGLILSLLFSLMFLPPFLYRYKNVDDDYHFRISSWMERSVLFPFPQRMSILAERELLIWAMASGLYFPYQFEYQKLDAINADMEPGKAENVLDDLWYHYDENQYFCKLEFIVKNMPRSQNPPQVWLRDSTHVTGYVPFARKDMDRMKQRYSLDQNIAPYLERGYTAFLFTAKKDEGCRSEIRVWHDGRVSKNLKIPQDQ